MREIKIERFCDICFVELNETRTQATKVWTIGLADSESRPALYTLETCDTHTERFSSLRDVVVQLTKYQEGAREVVAQTQPLFTKAAAGSGKGSRGPRPRDEDGNMVRRAPVEACEICGTEYTRGGLIMHIFTSHAKITRPIAPTSCPDCDYSGSTQSVGQHRTNHHGYSALQDAYSHVKGYRRPRQHILAS